VSEHRQSVSTANPIRVLLVHDHPLARQALRTMLQTFSNVLIVGEATTGEEAVESAGTLQPTIVVMDISLPALEGIATLTMNYPHIVVIGISGHTAGYQVYATIKAGAVEVLPKLKALDLYGVMQRAAAA
jgi:DNA-binding NarL/FixJ family response regulator